MAAAKRTGNDEDDDRVVHGGELPDDDNEMESPAKNNSQIDNTPSPKNMNPHTKSVPAYTIPSPAYPNPPPEYTLQEKVVNFLDERCTKDTMLELIGSKKLPEHMKSLGLIGADFFSLEDLVYVRGLPRLHSLKHYYKNAMSLSLSSGPLGLQGTLKLSKEVPYQIFKALIIGMCGYDAFGNAAGLAGIQDTPNFGTVNLEDKNIQTCFPVVRELGQFCGEYLITKDPYLLLLAVNPGARQFLSASLDKAIQKGEIDTKFDSVVYKASTIYLNSEISELLEDGMIRQEHIYKSAAELQIQGPELRFCLEEYSKLITTLTQIKEG